MEFRKLQIILVTTLGLALLFNTARGQINYYSASSGNLDALTTWGINTDGSGSNPTDFSTGGQIFNIRNNPAPTISTGWTVSGTGSKVIAGDGINPCTFIIPTGIMYSSVATDISNNAVIRNQNSTVNSLGICNVMGGGSYEHDMNGGTIPIAIWQSGSNCNITGIISSLPLGFKQDFYNVLFDSPGINISGMSFNSNNFPTEISGLFEIRKTGNKTLAFNSLSENWSGDMLIDNSGTITMTNINSGNNPTTFNLRDLTLKGPTLTLNSNTASPSTAAFVLNIRNLNVMAGKFSLDGGNDENTTVNITGNLTISGTGQITRLGFATGGSFNINFNGTIQQNVNISSTTNPIISAQPDPSTGIIFTANPGSIVNFQTAFSVGTSGSQHISFVAANGSTLMIPDTAGINNAGATRGSVVVGTLNGSTTYSSGANYIYTGSSSQKTGNGLPATIDRTGSLRINNSSGVTLTNSVEFSGTANLILNSGNLFTGSNNAAFDATVTNPSEINSSMIIGTGLMNARAAGTSAFPTFLGLALAAGGNDIGNMILKRVTGSPIPSGTGLPQASIKCYWKVTVQQNSLVNKTISLSWLSALDYPSSFSGTTGAEVYYSTDGINWTATGNITDVSGNNPRQISVQVPAGASTSTTYWTIAEGPLSTCSPPISTTIYVTETKIPGDSISYTLSPAGTEPFSYQWRKGGTNIKDATNNIFEIRPVTCADSGIYSCKINNSCDSIIVKVSHVYILNCSRFKFAIYGYVKYDNSDSTAMSSKTENTITTAYLKNSGDVILDSINTDDRGYYIFTDLVNDTYRLQFKTKKPWGGANPVDALMVNRNYIGLYTFTDAMKIVAADVSNDKKINPVDALMINRRYIGILHKFNIGDWIFEEPTIIVNGANVSKNIRAICAGDVNTSEVPPGKKIVNW